MNFKGIHICSLLAVLLFSAGCSTKKNTWLSRNYQAMNTRFNIFFNANESYKQGMNRIRKNNVDDYSRLLPMYAISNHENAGAAMSDMDRSILKTQTAIKKRSIRKRPKKNPKKAHNEKYQSFLRREEYNPAMTNVWLLLGKSQFHAADFLSAAATFKYVTKHFTEDKNAVSVANLWLARSYVEMDWLYEAENVINKLEADEFPPKQSGFFAAVNADLLMKQKRYDEAVPYLKVAIENERNRKQRIRFKYILAQLYEMQGEREKAYEIYKEVQKKSESFDMAFNAQIHLTENYVGENKDEVLHILRKMAKSPRNADYLDRIYTAIGNIHRADGNTEKAAENYRLAVEKSVRGGYDKAVALIALADLYYEKEKYRESGPHYTDASAIMNAQSDDFQRVYERSQMLAALNADLAEVELQDSLQELSRLSEKEKNERIQKIIARVKAEEQAAREAEEAARRQAESAYGAGSLYSSNTASNIAMSMNGGAAAFYFYNVQLVSAGKLDFQKKWGNRRLEDNWRRQVKTTMSNDFFASEESDEDEENEEDENAPEFDNKSPEFYLAQLYTEDEQFAESDEKIKKSLYDAGFIYGEQIENLPKAIETFAELERRFPSYDKLSEAYFFVYQLYKKENNTAEAEKYRDKLIASFPENRYAKILSQPDYEQKMMQMQRAQDSLYENAYFAYMESDYATVFRLSDEMERDYSASSLMPKMMFIKSLSKARSSSQEEFTASLRQLLADYPESDVASMSKELLAMLAQGRESQQGKSQGGLRALREQEVEAENLQNADDAHFAYDPQEKHLLVLVLPPASSENKWQFDMAAYNFSKFLIKDFDLEKRNYDDAINLLIVKYFENETEAKWYQNGLLGDKYFARRMAAENVTQFIISESNYKLMFYPFSMEEYQAFAKEVAANPALAQKPKPKKEQPKPAESVEVENVETEQVAEEAKPAEPETPQPETPQPKEEKPAEKPAESQPAAPQQKPAQKPVPPRGTPLEKKELPRFKGLYTYDPSAKHYFALYVLKGTGNVDALKAKIDAYNVQNYPLMNLKFTVQETPTAKIILVGQMPDMASARAYFLNLVKNRELFEPMTGVTYRNLIITEDNLRQLKSSRNISAYQEFLTVKRILK